MFKKMVLFVGGGTGGHIFPNLAVLERLRELNTEVNAHFVVSNRPLDGELMQQSGMAYTMLPARAWTARPWGWKNFAYAWRGSVSAVEQLIGQDVSVVMVASGGFVSAPALWAGRNKRQVKTALMNLDAVAGRANRVMARRAEQVFTVNLTRGLPRHQEQIGLPIRRVAIGPGDPGKARMAMGLDAKRPTLLVTGASQGAQTINQMMLELLRIARLRAELGAWQVLHLSGARDVQVLREAYEQAGVSARVEAFVQAMGVAWGSATLAISRAGAGSVAEVWANAVPTIFLPYPYHRDHHQRHNAEELARIGGAVIVDDLIDPKLNSREVAGLLINLMRNEAQRKQMAQILSRHQPMDGAHRVAQWVHSHLI